MCTSGKQMEQFEGQGMKGTTWGDWGWQWGIECDDMHRYVYRYLFLCIDTLSIFIHT